MDLEYRFDNLKTTLFPFWDLNQEWKVTNNYKMISEIENKLKDGSKVLLEIDWQGALQIMEHYPKAESIFISPPSVDELRKRLTERGLDTEEVIDRRIKGAQTELDQSKNFKHQISNISLDIATKNLLNIMFRENHG